MTQEPLNVGVIGLGVGERHVAGYTAIDGCEVRTLCDIDEKRLADVADHYGIGSRVTDFRAITEDPAIDVVSVCGYDDGHAEQVISAITNGKHVMVEKPMCLSEEETDAIEAALKAHPGIKLTSNLPLRTCPRFARVRSAVRADEMGTVYHMEADYIWGRPHKLTDGWRRNVPFYSIVLGASVHMIDLLIWIKGEAPVETSGYGSRRAFEDRSLGFDDFAVNLFRFADGTCAKVAAHGGGAHPHFHSLNVFGTESTFFQTYDNAFWIADRDPNARPRPETVDYPAKSERWRVLERFIGHILDPSKKPLVGASDVFATMRVSLAADRAIRDGRPQSIPNLSLGN